MRQALAVVLLTPFLTAQEPDPAPADASTPRPGQVQEPTKMDVDGRLGVDITSSYFFRGLLQENQGVIAQPYVELAWALQKSEQDLRRLDLTMGQWNSLHDEKTGSTGNMWYESDFYIGLEADIGERWETGVKYVAYSTPNNSVVFSKNANTVQELVFTVGYQDRGDILDAFEGGLRPTVTLAFEMDGQRDVVTGGSTGAYLGIGIEPAFGIGKLDETELTLKLPVTLGLGLWDYYEDPTGGNNDVFGFLQFGGVVAAPMKFMPAGMGPWVAEAGLHGIFLGDNNENRNGNDAFDFIFTLGFETKF